MNKTYFEEFQSYKKALDEAKGFQICIHTTDGKVIESSTIPIALLDKALNEAADESGITVWDYGYNRITLVPTDRIQHVVIQFKAELPSRHDT